ncbi:ubiquinone/menaquinone biosynthesis C-methylase UbiE [Nakamurella sp. UYEF19]|uniref:class I SAM-dependent methyltransferase n=1 Tax=Nakamurella sp. UYEF19 TaxID=1756392 RepID=UPI0033940C3E
MSAESAATRWDAEAETFDEAADHGLLDPEVRAAWRALLLHHLPAPPGRILDLGCGTGTLTALLADEGYRVDGVDCSPEMIRLAETKTAGLVGVTLLVADAFDPPVEHDAYDVVLCRHLLWAMPDPGTALRNWTQLLTADGVLLLVEGRWSNDVGLSAEQVVAFIQATSRAAELTRLTDPIYWGRAITDDRYLVVSLAS